MSQNIKKHPELYEVQVLSGDQSEFTCYSTNKTNITIYKTFNNHKAWRPKKQKSLSERAKLFSDSFDF